MRRIIYLLVVAIACSCNNKKEEVVVKETKSFVDHKNPLNKLKYVNKIDFYCKMDNTKYGISDTATYKGKLYGFCSATCKHEFLMTPEEYLAKEKQ